MALPNFEKKDKKVEWQVFTVKTSKNIFKRKVEELEKSPTAKGAQKIAMDSVDKAIHTYLKKLKSAGMPKDILTNKQESYNGLPFDLIIIRNPQGEPHQWCDLRVGKHSNNDLSWNKYPQKKLDMGIL